MKQQNAIKFFFKMVKPFYSLLFVQLLIVVCWAFDVSFSPYLVKVMLDRITESTPDTVVSLLFYPSCLYLFMRLFMSLIFRLSDYIGLLISPKLKSHVGEYVIDNMLKHSQRFYQSHYSGALSNKVKDLTNGVPDLLMLVVEQFIPTVLTIFMALLFVGSVHIEFALGLTVWVVIYILGSIWLTSPASALTRNAAEARSELTGYYVDLFNNIMSVRLFSGYKTERLLTRKKFDVFVKAERARDLFFQKLFFFQGLTFVVYQAISIYLLIHGLKHSLITTGDFVLILSLNIEMIHTLWTFSRDIGDYATIVGTIDQALLTLNQKIDIVDVPHAQLLAVPLGEICYDNVSFGHKNHDAFFKDLSLTIKPGQKVGLVGYSGGGKTTFVNLLLRLFDVTRGAINIDGQNIAHVTQDSLRDAISFIPQDPGLFQRSILENISYGRPDASFEEIQRAAIQAHAHEFIMNLPAQYNTEIGERGLKISGGQRQRIALARAILKNAPILILDEATSQLDTLTEQDIQFSVEALMLNKTTLVIAHRLSTLQSMDRILVLDNGVIVQDGSHATLSSIPGLYQQLWYAQKEGLLQVDREDEQTFIDEQQA